MLSISNVYVSGTPDLEKFRNRFPDVNVVIDVSDEGGLFNHRFYAEMGISYFWFPMAERYKDMGISSLFGALVILHDCHRKKLNVLLHCIQGQNRSVSVYEAFKRITEEIGIDEGSQLLMNANGFQLPENDSLNIFLNRVKKYLANKSFFIGGPLDWCKEGL